jgi:hypothetical protein
MSNYWKDKPHFWLEKQRHPAYGAQKAEAAKALTQILSAAGLKTTLDVGGYDGSFAKFLATPYRQKYTSIDFKNGYDLTQPWGPQGLNRRKFDVVMANITLLVIPPDKLQGVIDQMYQRANHALFIVEEDPEYRQAGEQINDEYGGKWAVTQEQLTDGQQVKEIKVERSHINKKWLKYTIIKEQPATLL